MHIDDKIIEHVKFRRNTGSRKVTGKFCEWHRTYENSVKNYDQREEKR